MTGKWRVYRDADGELWIDPGDQKLSSVDWHVIQMLREAKGAVSRDAVERALGPLAELTAHEEEPLPHGLERWPLLNLARGKSEAESADVAVRIACRARDVGDCRDLLEACGLMSYQKGSRL